jgi:hypothetical protein
MTKINAVTRREPRFPETSMAHLQRRKSDRAHPLPARAEGDTRLAVWTEGVSIFSPHAAASGCSFSQRDRRTQ